MEFGPFYTKFRKIAEKETRVLTILKPEFNVPLGEYAFIEYYCDDDNCDCRKVIITVVDAKNPNKTFATIGYGWESYKFYLDWMYGDKKTAMGLVGAYLEPIGTQTKYSEKFLLLFKNVVLKDKIFQDNIKNHYSIYKSDEQTKKLN